MNEAAKKIFIALFGVGIFIFVIMNIHEIIWLFGCGVLLIVLMWLAGQIMEAVERWKNNRGK